jgi:N-acetyltransferase
MGLERLADIETTRLTHGRVRLEYLADRHKEPLRVACAADPDVWLNLYSYSMLGEAFDAWWAGHADWVRFAVLCDDEVVGTTSYLNIAHTDQVTEIGGTYLAPSARGGAVNAPAKLLMLGNAFDAGARRVELRVDAINTRSRAAVEKLGTQLDGILRRHRITWTGRVRDTCVYSLLADEWPAVRDRLRASAEQA